MVLRIKRAGDGWFGFGWSIDWSLILCNEGLGRLA